MSTATWTYAYPLTSNKLSSVTSGTTKTYVHDADGAITSNGSNPFTCHTRARASRRRRAGPWCVA